jgi:hypothetical protein
MLILEKVMYPGCFKLKAVGHFFPAIVCFCDLISCTAPIMSTKTKQQFQQSIENMSMFDKV